MKKFFQMFFLLTFVSCSSSENKNVASHDSTTVANTQSEDSANVEDVNDEKEAPEADTTLEGQYAFWKAKIDAVKDSLYEARMSNHQYEASSDALWYFDKDFNAVYYSISWSMEGSEGSTELIADEGQVVCSYDEENSSSERWCQSTGGVRTEVDENSGEETKTELDASYGRDQTVQLREKVATLSSFIQEAEVVEDEGDWVTLRVEEVIEIGEQQVTQYAEVRIQRKVYDELK